MNALSIQNVSKQFGGLQILNDISLDLEQGTRLAVIGPNGAGKTTLINVISGVLPPSKGSIFMFGKEVTGLPAYARSRLGISRTFQILSLFPNLSVLESVLLSTLPPSSVQLSLFRPIERFKPLHGICEKVLKEMGLWEKREMLISNLSHGEQKLVEMAMSLSQSPRLMLLDEPMAGLSLGETTLITSAIRALPSSVSLIMVEHNVDVALELAGRVVVLNQGMLLADGSPDEIRREPQVREVYLGKKESWRDLRSKKTSREEARG